MTVHAIDLLRDPWSVFFDDDDDDDEMTLLGDVVAEISRVPSIMDDDPPPRWSIEKIERMRDVDTIAYIANV